MTCAAMSLNAYVSVSSKNLPQRMDFEQNRVEEQFPSRGPLLRIALQAFINKVLKRVCDEPVLLSAWDRLWSRLPCESFHSLRAPNSARSQPHSRILVFPSVMPSESFEQYVQLYLPPKHISRTNKCRLSVLFRFALKKCPDFRGPGQFLGHPKSASNPNFCLSIKSSYLETLNSAASLLIETIGALPPISVPENRPNDLRSYSGAM